MARRSLAVTGVSGIDTARMFVRMRWMLTYRTWFWNRSLVDDFLIAAHKLHHDKTDTDLHVYTHERVSHIKQDVVRPL